MKTKILVILCEGQTEEKFANLVLKPHFAALGIVVKTSLLCTNRKLDCRGGILNYSQVKGDLPRLFKMYHDNDHEEFYFTSMLDYYALPADFPGQDLNYSLASDKVPVLEEKLGEDINYYKFIPYIQLHEFESLLFAGLNYLNEEYPDCPNGIKELEQALKDCYGDPERVNNSRETAPSKRIIKALAGKHHYNKPHVGAKIASKIGLENLRQKCQHFNKWVTTLEDALK